MCSVGWSPDDRAERGVGGVGDSGLVIMIPGTICKTNAQQWTQNCISHANQTHSSLLLLSTEVLCVAPVASLDHPNHMHHALGIS